MRPPDDGPSVPVKVSPEDLHHVAQQFSDAADGLGKLRENLRNGLRPAAGWAGIDDQARKFGQQFTDAYLKLETGIERARNVLYDIEQGIDIAARNHWLADQAAVPGAQPGEPPWATAPAGPFIPTEVAPFPIVGNATVRYPPPFDAKIPAGDPDKLRIGARAFYDSRDVLDAVTSALFGALYTLFAHNDSEDLRALDEFWQRVGGHSDTAILTAIRDACDALGRALDDLANWIVDTNNDIDRALNDVVTNIFEGILLALLLAALTEGLGAFFGAAESLGAAGEIVIAVDGVITAAGVTARIAAIGGAVGGVIGLMQVAINNTPNPDLNPTDPQVVTDSQITTDAKSLGDNADPGKVDESARRFSPPERKIADRLATDGHDVTSVPELGPGRNPDAMVDGRPTEFKSMQDEPADSGNVKNILDKSAKRGGQAPDILIDAEGVNLSREDALAGIQRFLGNKKGNFDSITIWLSDGTTVVWP
ncbi:MAG: hypothetical protein ACJ72N_01015 [Labedaea sp.]